MFANSSPEEPWRVVVVHGIYQNFFSVYILHRYGLFASVSTILKTNMGRYLKDIIKYMIDSLQSTEGIVVGHLNH